MICSPPQSPLPPPISQPWTCSPPQSRLSSTGVHRHGPRSLQPQSQKVTVQNRLYVMWTMGKNSFCAITTEMPTLTETCDHTKKDRCNHYDKGELWVATA